jgi:hypothetical protein
MSAMTADLELVLSHDGERWVAEGGSIRASGRTFTELDAGLREALRACGRFAGPRVTVFMGFDFDGFPVWMRQYAAHYFNRTATLDL